MISRTYIGRMSNVEATSLDIAVQNFPGTQAAPIAGGTNKAAVPSAATGAYYELRGRPIRFEQLALVGGAANPAFVRRARLGWRISTYIYGTTSTLLMPSTVLSASIVNSLDSTEAGGPIIATSALPDPVYGPTIRLVNSAALAAFGAAIVVVHFDILEPKDEDRDPNGSI